MKLRKQIVISTFAFFCSLPVMASLYNWKKNVFDISASAPPALMYVTDSQGRRTGGDPNQAVSSNGIQGGNAEAVMLQEIPLSEMDQSNESGADVTGWGVDILDADKQTYTVNLKGLAFGTERVELRINYKRHSKPTVKSAFEALVGPGITKKIQITFDPNNNNINTTRVVSNGDLLTDVKSACQLNLITSHKTCKRLEKKAEAIQDALDKKHSEQAEGLVKSFLKSLGDGDNDKDDLTAIKEPALTILKEDAQALLAQVEQEEQK